MHRPDPIAAAHDAAVRAGQAGYLDPRTGLFVMTTAWLASRGVCCGAGCRHCPYSPDEQALAGRPDVPARPWPGALRPT